MEGILLGAIGQTLKNTVISYMESKETTEFKQEMKLNA